MVKVTHIKQASGVLGGDASGSKGVDEFFSFYSQLQQSCLYYSNLAMRQMLVGYQHPVEIATNKFMESEKTLGTTNAAPTATISTTSAKINVPTRKFQSSVPAFHTPSRKTPLVRVVVSGCDEDTEDDSEFSAVAAGRKGSPRQRKVNFATPLSTVKMKSPTPIHSLEELRLDSSRTGFTSDSDEEGSETDVFCQYMWRVRNVQQQQDQLQVPLNVGVVGGSKKKKKRKKKNKKTKIQENGYDYDCYDHYWLQNNEEGYDEDDPNAVYEVPLNQDDYEFISEIRLCGPPTEKPTKSGNDREGSSGGGGGDGRCDEMKFLYGDSGSLRILKMEDTIEKSFMEAMKKVGRKY